MKQCKKCLIEKVDEEFHKNKTGLKSWCKSCFNQGRQKFYKENPEKYAKLRQELRDNGKQRSYHLLSTYGISKDQFDKMAKDQDNKCLICRREDKLCVDHDHHTGLIRGLLCNKCNRGLGLFQDDPLFLNKASQYLTLHKNKLTK